MAFKYVFYTFKETVYNQIMEQWKHPEKACNSKDTFKREPCLQSTERWVIQVGEDCTPSVDL